MFDEHKICFIICANKDYFLEECLFYINRLDVPEGYSVEVISIADAKSIASGYNEGMQASNARYKVYLHQDVFIVYQGFIQAVLDIFASDNAIGMIGMVGAPEMSPDGVMWNGFREGQLYGKNPEQMRYQEYAYSLEDGLHEVEAIDGLLMVTRQDVPWREDLFDGWDFYDVSQSFEFRRKGYRVVVPEQKNPWCDHNDGKLNLRHYDKYRKICMKEYPEYFDSRLGKIAGEDKEDGLGAACDGRCRVEKENELLKHQIKEIDIKLHKCYAAYQSLLQTCKENAEKINALNHFSSLLDVKLNNMKYEIMDPENTASDYFYPKFRSNEETLRLIIEEKKSLGRFGDGELAIAFGIPRQKFQRVDKRLAQRIWQVLNTRNDNLLVAVQNHYGNLDKYNEQGALGIRLYLSEETRRQHQEILSKDMIYSDSYITRPYVLYRDVFTEEPKKRFDALKQIWKDKRVIVVEGAQTRLGVRNDLFAGAREIRRIIAPPTSSFDCYDDILREALHRADEADLFLLAIGPSSGVLAYDLTVNGYQAVDVGHIDLEYEWFLAGKGTPGTCAL